MKNILIDAVFFALGAVVGFFIGLYFHRKQRTERREERAEQTETLISFFESRLPAPILQASKEVAGSAISQVENKERKRLDESDKRTVYSNALLQVLTAPEAPISLSSYIVTPEIRDKAANSLANVILSEEEFLGKRPGIFLAGGHLAVKRVDEDKKENGD